MWQLKTNKSPPIFYTQKTVGVFSSKWTTKDMFINVHHQLHKDMVVTSPRVDQSRWRTRRSGAGCSWTCFGNWKNGLSWKESCFGNDFSTKFQNDFSTNLLVTVSWRWVSHSTIDFWEMNDVNPGRLDNEILRIQLPSGLNQAFRIIKLC